MHRFSDSIGTIAAALAKAQEGFRPARQTVLLSAVAQAGARTAAVLVDELGASGFKGRPKTLGVVRRGSRVVASNRRTMPTLVPVQSETDQASLQ